MTRFIKSKNQVDVSEAVFDSIDSFGKKRITNHQMADERKPIYLGIDEHVHNISRLKIQVVTIFFFINYYLGILISRYYFHVFPIKVVYKKMVEFNECARNGVEIFRSSKSL